VVLLLRVLYLVSLSKAIKYWKLWKTFVHDYPGIQSNKTETRAACKNVFKDYHPKMLLKAINQYVLIATAFILIFTSGPTLWNISLDTF